MYALKSQRTCQEGASKEVKKSIKYLEKAFDKAKVQHLLWHIDMSSDSLFTNDVCVITREYTPISTWEEFVQTRTMKILIKLYPEGNRTCYGRLIVT